MSRSSSAPVSSSGENTRNGAAPRCSPRDPRVDEAACRSGGDALAESKPRGRRRLTNGRRLGSESRRADPEPVVDDHGDRPIPHRRGNAALRSATLGCVLHAGRSARFELLQCALFFDQGGRHRHALDRTDIRGNRDLTWNGRRPGAHGSRMKFSVNASTWLIAKYIR